MQPRRVPLSSPEVGTEILEAAAEIATSLIAERQTPTAHQFEEFWSRWLGCSTAGLQSGTAALHLGLKAAGVSEQDEVLVPTFSFAACCHAISYERAVPIIIDSEPRSWNLDPDLFEKFLKKRARTNRFPKAAIVVHNYGQCADLSTICELCRQYDIILIEDAAEAVGAIYRGKPLGTFGDLGVFSFNCNKIITGLGGGALVSKRSDWIDQARCWSCQSREAGPDYIHRDLGYNYRMNPISAALVLHQLPLLEERVERRRKIFERYQDGLNDLPGIEGQLEAVESSRLSVKGSRREPGSEIDNHEPAGDNHQRTENPQPITENRHSHTRHTHWLSCFLIDEKKFGMSAAGLIRYLDASNIESRSVWKPMHTQPFYKRYECIGGAVAEDLNRRGICLPSSSALTEEEQQFVIERVRAAHRS